MRAHAHEIFRQFESRETVKLMLELGSKFLISYLIGSLMGSLIMGQLKGGVDIRTMGSRNAGATNALRTQGLAFAVGVMLIDVGKGVIGTAIVPGLELPFVGTDPEISRTWLTLCCAAAAVMGHVWPIYHRFRGGKGAATMVGTLLVLEPVLVLPVILVWAWVLTLAGFVGLATMAAAVALPAWLAATRLPEDQPLFIYSVAMAMFIIYCHRSNIQRMRDGTEHRHTKLMIFRSRRQSVSDDET
ncbi:MAG: glycerol-3-phosphate 1-O-acyltransferase PlsY [Gammaproteobacteria bacterium]|nr:glycerol-3-phosphate 1-O-acyltransferase PlsY [Gammaproteobacteria bacterium]